MEVLLLQLGALLIALLGGPVLCFPLALHCDDFGFELFLLLFEHDLMGLLYDLDILMVGIALLPHSVL